MARRITGGRSGLYTTIPTATGTAVYSGGTLIQATLGTNNVIRTNPTTINENITIPSGTNGQSSGPITIGSGFTVTVTGDWSIV